MMSKRRSRDNYSQLPLAAPGGSGGSLLGARAAQRGRGAGRKTCLEEFVGELTLALPMRSAFYHHVAFSVLTTQLPWHNFDLCTPTFIAAGWACMGVCAAIAFGYSLFVEANVLWALFSLLVYAVFAYASTPQFFSCYDAIYVPEVGQYMVVVLLVVLVAIKLLIGVWKWCAVKNGAEDLRNLNTLEGDLETFKTDM